MIKTFFKDNFFALIALCFIIPIVFFIFYLINNNNIDNLDILRYGIETDGYVISETASTHTTINNQEYYSIEYRFYDEKNVEHFGKTSESYTYFEIQKIIDQEIIKIKYIPESFESIESQYKIENDKGGNIIKIFLVLMIMIDTLVWVVAIIKGRNNLILRKVEKDGVEYIGFVTGISSGTEVNGVTKYKVHYNFKNELGESFSKSTDSIYFHDEARALELIKQVTIKAIGKHSIIATKPDVSSLYINNIEDNNETPINKYIICEYCGNSVLSTNQQCSNCGASIINRDNE